MKEYLYKLEMKVRDYECDIQGVVNNANYIHYLEATRHEWLSSNDLSFRKWHEQGIETMVSEINIKYKASLHGQEEFISCLNLHRDGPRFIFDQDIYRKEDMRLCVSAQVSTICVIDGRVTRGDEVMPFLGKFL